MHESSSVERAPPRRIAWPAQPLERQVEPLQEAPVVLRQPLAHAGRALVHARHGVAPGWRALRVGEARPTARADSALLGDRRPRRAGSGNVPLRAQIGRSVALRRRRRPSSPREPGRA